MPDRQVFEPEEIVLAGRVLVLLAEIGTQEAFQSTNHISDVMNQLVCLRDVVTAYTSVICPQVVAGELRDVNSLSDAICRSNPYTVEASLPTRAVVGRAYLVAKFNFLRLLVRVVTHHMKPGEKKDELVAEVRRFVRQAVTTLIAEDILISISSDQNLDIELRYKATYLLADLWEYRTARSVSDFFPMLISVWEAKTKITISYGTLSGTSEILSMMREGCDPTLIDYFTGDHISEEERHALKEMIFNATYEELETMRTYMGRQGKGVLGPKDVAEIFNVPLTRLHQTIDSPEDMFFTFRERQVNAYHRQVHNITGPKKTAEEYMMIYYLQQNEISIPQPHSTEDIKD
jgi:hypothetical protein